MKKLFLLCFLVVLSGNFYAQETATTTKAKSEATAKKKKADADKAAADAKRISKSKICR